MGEVVLRKTKCHDHVRQALRSFLRRVVMGNELKLRTVTPPSGSGAQDHDLIGLQTEKAEAFFRLEP